MSHSPSNSHLQATPTRPWPANWSRNTPEDVTFTGILAQNANINRYNIKGFEHVYDRKRAYDVCRQYSLHGFHNATALRDKWKRLQYERRSCRKKV
jgi:hypothetical protein